MKSHITRTRLKDQVAEHILETISSGAFKQGDRLPPEREIVARLGVSRTVVREALNLLEARGIIRIEHGRGAIVDINNGQAIQDAVKVLVRADSESLWDLLEVRKMLEVEIAGLAAERASEEDIRDMRAALDRMQEKIEEPEGYVDADVEFHTLLARSAHNKVLLMMTEPITDLLLASRKLTGSQTTNARRALSAHDAILKRLQARDVSGARREMHEHLMTTERDIRAAIGNQENSDPLQSE